MKPSVTVQYHSHPDFPAVEIADVSSSSHSFPRHFHDGIYALGIVERGASYCLKNNDADTIVDRDSVVNINPGQIHTGIPYDGMDIAYKMIYFEAGYLNERLKALTGHNAVLEFEEFVPRASELRQSLLLLSTAVIGKRDKKIVELLIQDALMAMEPFTGLGHSNKSLPGGRDLSVAREALSSHLESNILLDDLSSHMGLSKFQFIRGFQKAYGMTPHAFRVQCRLNEAGRLVRAGESLSQIALLTGFSDQSHFSKSFLKYYGATPQQYAAS